MQSNRVRSLTLAACLFTTLAPATSFADETATDPPASKKSEGSPGMRAAGIALTVVGAVLTVAGVVLIVESSAAKDDVKPAVFGAAGGGALLFGIPMTLTGGILWAASGPSEPQPIKGGVAAAPMPGTPGFTLGLRYQTTF